MIIKKEIDYKTRDIFNNDVNYYYFEYEDCFVTNLRVLTDRDLKNIDKYTSTIEADIFDNNHIMHHDFRLLNGILYSLKQKGYNCQAFKVKDGWKIYKKVNDWTPFISQSNGNNFWLSPCKNFYIEKHVLNHTKSKFVTFDLRAIGVKNTEIGFRSSVLEDVLEEYYKPELHIQLLYFTKDYEKYKNKLLECLK